MKLKNVKKLIPLLLFLLINNSVWSQNIETVYLLFEECKNNAKIISEEKDKIEFYINKENFKCINRKESIDTLDISLLDSFKVLKIDELKLKETNVMKEIGKEIKQKYDIPFPAKTMYHNMFNIYLIEKMDCNKFVKYKVNWQYYIE